MSKLPRRPSLQQKDSSEKKIKCVVVGDSRTGKKELINALVLANPNNDGGTANTQSDKTMFESKVTNALLNNEIYTCSFYCPNGQEEYDRLRPLLYQETDIFIIAFSIDDVVSLENVRNKWHPEIQNYTPKVPFILVGTKSDMRAANNVTSPRELIKESDALGLAQELKAIGYIECSAKSTMNLKLLFDTVIQRQVTKKSNSKCLIM